MKNNKIFYREKMATEHKIICGDCIEELRKLEAESVDLVLTDPPFNIGKDYGKYKDRLKKENYIDWCEKWLEECVRVLKDGGALYLFNYPENNAYLMPFLDDKLTFKRWMTWHYPVNTGMSPTNFTRSQHSILFYVKGDKPKTFNKDEIAEPYRNPNDKRILERLKNGSKGKTPYDVFQFNLVKNVSKEKTAHPCQLPPDLIKIFVKASSKKGDLVLDPFGGSFTTSAVAKELDRHSISIEINPEFCKIGKERLGKTSPLKDFV
ncbi:MAG: site-specific DNA-methyltransferase [Nanoarchaeota archaeon]|nr:site-specific DNA-methyltransferase [Nanoarchaeota archaeon]